MGVWSIEVEKIRVWYGGLTTPPVVPPTVPPPMPYGRVFITDPTGPISDNSTCFSNPWTWRKERHASEEEENVIYNGPKTIQFKWS